ncbi:hypothetical protein B0T20DRAFT_45923 [Sordaria brevicollis]|uniref:Uncharacterized protein n=1 Tax=Sordaria brevicollis TaxID=83679 RepID=A0AAE0P9C9_SORBR|nr:hypothetical protein B0T20DRAFT_45923 [Sordaria brevicollis]
MAPPIGMAVFDFLLRTQRLLIYFLDHGSEPCRKKHHPIGATASRTPDEPRGGSPNASGPLTFRDLQRSNTCKLSSSTAVNATRRHRHFPLSPLPDISDELTVSLFVFPNSVAFNFISFPDEPRSHLRPPIYIDHRGVLYAGANRRSSACLVATGREHRHHSRESWVTHTYPPTVRYHTSTLSSSMSSSTNKETAPFVILVGRSSGNSPFHQPPCVLCALHVLSSVLFPVTGYTPGISRHFPIVPFPSNHQINLGTA